LPAEIIKAEGEVIRGHIPLRMPSENPDLGCTIRGMCLKIVFQVFYSGFHQMNCMIIRLFKIKPRNLEIS